MFDTSGRGAHGEAMLTTSVAESRAQWALGRAAVRPAHSSAPRLSSARYSWLHVVLQFIESLGMYLHVSHGSVCTWRTEA